MDIDTGMVVNEFVWKNWPEGENELFFEKTPASLVSFWRWGKNIDAILSDPAFAKLKENKSFKKLQRSN